MDRQSHTIKSFQSTWTTLQGIELMYTIKKGQMIGCARVLQSQDSFIRWLLNGIADSYFVVLN